MKTKTLVMLAAINFGWFISLSAQKVSNKERYRIVTSSSYINLAKQTSSKLDVTILKSRLYKKAEVALSVSGYAQHNVILNIEKDSVDKNLYQLTFSADENATVGRYTIIVYGMFARKRKGKMVILEITKDPNKDISISSSKN